MIPAPIGLDWITSIESKQRLRWREIGIFSKQVLYPQALTRTRLALDKKILHPILFLWPERGLCSMFFSFFSPTVSKFKYSMSEDKSLSVSHSQRRENSKKDWATVFLQGMGVLYSYLQMISFVRRISGRICPPIVACTSTCTSPSYIGNVICLWSRM